MNAILSASLRSSSGHSALVPSLPAMPAVLLPSPAIPCARSFPQYWHFSLAGCNPAAARHLLLFAYGRPCLPCLRLDGPCLSPTAHSVGKSNRRDGDLSRGIGLCLQLRLCFPVPLSMTFSFPLGGSGVGPWSS